MTTSLYSARERSKQQIFYNPTWVALEWNFIPPEMIAEVCGIRYSNDQLALSHDKFPTQEQIKKCHEQGLSLMPGPPEPMSDLEVRDLSSSNLLSSKQIWYGDNKFAHTDKVGPGWIAYQREPAAGSLGKSWLEYNWPLGAVPFEEPNAAERLWIFLINKAVRGEYLFQRICVRTSSLLDKNGDKDRDRMAFGYYAPDDIRAVAYSDTDAYPDLGSAGIWKFRSA
ncbi:MAG: hypothetical protein G01um101456_213 [Parcubacteria group bacterium Gr01-1014_56]|nr:MAG: hypothetical protein G01um101456_213 [Parcubacteria group bacterium Gr01-1014_56]